MSIFVPANTQRFSTLKGRVNGKRARLVAVSVHMDKVWE